MTPGGSELAPRLPDGPAGSSGDWGRRLLRVGVCVGPASQVLRKTPATSNKGLACCLPGAVWLVKGRHEQPHRAN